jgi:hypothetical protein
MEEHKVIRIECLNYTDDEQETVAVTKRMLENMTDLRFGLVSSFNMYNKQTRRAPLYGVPPRGMIFKVHNN